MSEPRSPADYTAAIVALQLPPIVRWVVEVSPRRRQLGIALDPDGQITIAVRAGADPVTVAEVVRQRRIKLIQWAQQHERCTPAHPVKELVSGEGFRWLGSSHRLRVVDEHDRPIGFEFEHRHQSWLLLHRDHRDPQTIIDWYRGMGVDYAAGVAERWAARLCVAMPSVEVADLGDRCHSGYRRGVLRLHWAVFQLVPELVRYLVVRELTQAHTNGKMYGPVWCHRMDTRVLHWRDREKTLAVEWASVWLGAVHGIEAAPAGVQPTPVSTVQGGLFELEPA